VVEDGEIEILVGTSSADLVSAGHVVVKTAGPIEKAFDGSVTSTDTAWSVELLLLGTVGDEGRPVIAGLSADLSVTELDYHAHVEVAFILVRLKSLDDPHVALTSYLLQLEPGWFAKALLHSLERIPIEPLTCLRALGDEIIRPELVLEFGRLESSAFKHRLENAAIVAGGDHCCS
jgi:hypothetical protein